MKKKPLITVITVVYNLIKENRKEYFRQCLESVQSQTYKNIEHIVVDGASDDGTVDLLKEYSDKGWIKYISESDESLYDAMNKGVNLAQGKYITFLNSDDFYDSPKGLEKCIKKLEAKNADFSYAKAKIIDEFGKNPFKRHLFVKPDIAKVFWDMPFSHQTMIVKTEVFKNLGMYNLEYKSASDYDFVLKMIFNKCSYTFCNLTLANFRVGGFSIVNNELSANEISHFYQKYYNKFFPLTIEDARSIYVDKFLAFPIIKNLLPYLNFKNKFKFIFYQLKIRFNKIRRSILQIRFNRQEKFLKIFGKKII